MKAIISILLFSYIISSSISDILTPKERKEKKKEQIDHLYECLNEKGTDFFKQLINENKGIKFSTILKDHRVSLTRQDKNAVKECRKKILLDSKNYNYDSNINNKVNLKRAKVISEN